MIPDTPAICNGDDGVRPGSVAAVVSTAFAIDPARVAFDIVFFFPDWQSNLQFIDDVAAGFERLVPMRGGDTDPNGSRFVCLR